MTDPVAATRAPSPRRRVVVTPQCPDTSFATHEEAGQGPVHRALLLREARDPAQAVLPARDHGRALRARALRDRLQHVQPLDAQLLQEQPDPRVRGPRLRLSSVMSSVRVMPKSTDVFKVR